MATAARGIRCELRRFQTPAVRCGGDQPLPPAQVTVPKLTKKSKIMLQPRLCTLRSYGSEGSDLVSVMKTKKDGGGVVGDEAMSFFATLSDYIDSSKKSQDFEIVSGRLAMVVFAVTVTKEVVTGNSLFGKVETEGIAEAAGVGLAAVTCAVVAAVMTSARTRVGRIFSLGCNSFINSLIDQIVDGLFYDTDITDWSDDV
ncbi:stress enhanced protein 2, chloroplastic [Argentina anserina]|uniref:stress enhanced protein 2, chloroplastic n=1 Tax=Argentina anserina TaxID=57926 RepID=UPI0021765323|nr:stress enhanced protein 2, chloroplastic [Potentilla anserina]